MKSDKTPHAELVEGLKRGRESAGQPRTIIELLPLAPSVISHGKLDAGLRNAIDAWEENITSGEVLLDVIEEAGKLQQKLIYFLQTLLVQRDD